MSGADVVAGLQPTAARAAAATVLPPVGVELATRVDGLVAWVGSIVDALVAYEAEVAEYLTGLGDGPLPSDPIGEVFVRLGVEALHDPHLEVGVAWLLAAAREASHG